MNTTTKRLSCLVIAILYLNAANATINHILPKPVHTCDRSGDLSNKSADTSQDDDIQLRRRHATGFSTFSYFPAFYGVMFNPTVFNKISYHITTVSLQCQLFADCAVGDLPPPILFSMVSV